MKFEVKKHNEDSYCKLDYPPRQASGFACWYCNQENVGPRIYAFLLSSLAYSHMLLEVVLIIKESTNF